MRYRLLGAAVRADHLDVGGGQLRRALVALLLDTPTPVSPRDLARWSLGPARQHETAQVHVLVSRLRRHLATAGLTDGIELTAEHGYRFITDPCEVDVRCFEDYAASTERLDLHRALALVSGHALDELGFRDHPVVRRLRSRRAEIACDLLDADVSAPDNTTIEAALAVLDDDLGHERLCALAMRALYARGRRSEALAIYQRTRMALGSRGLEPGADLRDTEARILRHELGAELPAVRPMPNGPASVPRYATSFVGRIEEIRHVREALASPGVITILGPGGIGKTRLVCEALQGVEASFVDLVRLGPATDIRMAVAMLVGARPAGNQDPIAALAAELSGERAVLVLDGCEELGPDVTPMLQALSEWCPQITIILTSRTPVTEFGVRLVLEPLSTLDDAIRLFTQRAIDRDIGYRLDPDDGDTIAALCERLDRNPLAIELAAAQSRMLRAAEILARLESETGLLQDTSRQPARHQTIDAVLQWSYQMLEETDRRVFRRLGVFAGVVGVDAGRAVVQDLDITTGRFVAALDGLASQSLITSHRTRGTARFGQLDTVRSFARQLLVESDEWPRAARAHADAYAALTATTRARLRTDDEPAAVAELDEHWPELRAAVERSLATGDAQRASALIRGLGFEAVFRERSEVVAWTERATALRGIYETPGIDELIGTAALADWGYGHFERGLARAELAVRLHRRHGTRLTPDVAAALPLHLALSDVGRAVRVLHEHAAEAAETHQHFAHTHMVICEAMGLAYVGAHDRVKPLLERAHRLAEDIGVPLLQAIAHFTSAIDALDHDPLQAAAHARRCLVLADSVSATWFLTGGTNYLTAALARSDDLESAAHELWRALDRQVQGGTVQSAANTIRNAIVVLDRWGRPLEAAPLLGWLDLNRPSIPGSPGMRAHPVELAERLARTSGTTFAALAADGRTFSLRAALDYARERLGGSG